METQSYNGNYRYIFFADKVEVEDITDKTYFFSLVGPKSNEVQVYTLECLQLVTVSASYFEEYNTGMSDLPNVLPNKDVACYFVLKWHVNRSWIS